MKKRTLALLLNPLVWAETYELANADVQFWEEYGASIGLMMTAPTLRRGLPRAERLAGVREDLADAFRTIDAAVVRWLGPHPVRAYAGMLLRGPRKSWHELRNGQPLWQAHQELGRRAIYNEVVTQKISRTPIAQA